LADAELLKVGSGSLLATVSMDNLAARGNLSFDARITESLSAVVDGWVERKWNDGRIDFGVMGGVRVTW